MKDEFVFESLSSKAHDRWHLNCTFFLFHFPLSEGYEAVAHARGGTLVVNRDLDTENRNASTGEAEDIFADDETEARGNDPLSSTAASVSVDINLQSLQASSSGGLSGTVDIFGEDDEADVQDTISHHPILQGEALQSANSSGSNTFGGEIGIILNLIIMPGFTFFFI
jgi:hypothetical protein